MAQRGGQQVLRRYEAVLLQESGYATRPENRNYSNTMPQGQAVG